MQFSIATLAVLATAVMAESTLYITEEVTITSCAPTVTDCPSKSTVVSLTSYPVITSSAAPVVPEHPEGPETITQYTTLLQTITSCAPTVTDCPYGSVTSTVVPVHPTAPAPIHPGDNSTATYVAPEQPKPTAPVHPTTLVPAPSVVTITVTECPVETPALPTKPVEETPVVPHYPVETKPVEETPVVPHYPVETKPVEETPVTPTKPVVPVVPSGVPQVPGNGTTPVYPTGTGAIVPSKTPVFTGAASVNTVSALAFAGVIAALFA